MALSLRDLFKKKDIKIDAYSSVLNKPAFVSELKAKGLEDSEIEKYWVQMEKIFSLAYFLGVYNALDESKRKEITGDTVVDETGAGFDVIFPRILELLNKDMNVVDQASVIKEAAELSEKKIIEYMEGKYNV